MKTLQSLLQDYACYHMIQTKILFLHDKKYIVRTEGAKLLCDILEIPYQISPKYSELMTYPSDFLCESIMRIACIWKGIRNGPLEPDYDLRLLVALISHLPYFRSCFMQNNGGISSILPSMSPLWIMPPNIKIGHSMILEYSFTDLKRTAFNTTLNSTLIQYLADVDENWASRIKVAQTNVQTNTITQEEYLWMMCLMAGLLPEEQDFTVIQQLPPLTWPEQCRWVEHVITTVTDVDHALSTTEIILNV